MAPRGYPAEFRQRVVDLVEAGRPVAQIAAELGTSDQSIYTWRRQARTDTSVEPGMNTAEHAELAALRKRVRELETELAIHRRAAELLKGDGDLVLWELRYAMQPFTGKAPQVIEQHPNPRVGVDRRIFGALVLCT